MYAQKRDSMIKNALKSLCSSNGWCYGIFWGFDLRNSLLLTLKEAYYEEQMGALIDSMLLQAHVLGGGVIGQAAFLKNHRWMYSDGIDESQNSLASFDSLELYEEDSEFFWQFSMGIKTISVISVEPWGVVQLGSTHKNPETESFVDEVKQVLREMDNWSEIKIIENEGGICNCVHQRMKNEAANHSSPWPHQMDYEESWKLEDLCLVDHFSPIDNNLPPNSLQSSVKETQIDALNFTSDVPECVASNTLFSKLGIDHLLDGIPIASTSSSSSSAKRKRKIDSFSWSHKQVTFQDFTKEEAHSCVDHAGKTSTSRGQQQHIKFNKKKAKPGTRPRPKDRQMIQDRLSELRELIPNGEKMSIDRLLERTIRHLNFMQSLTKHAATLKQIDEPKSEEVINNGGVTWACEVGDQNMICPLIVEDLSTPGQMLIEMLCEEQGLFLEIVDIIRGFGLSIHKGVMEVHETNKIWAHFMVEAEGNRCISRHEIFSSLIQLLQMTGQSANHDHGNVMSLPMSGFNNFEAFPINFPDALQCGSL
ncbi:hypothetical protein ACS0TY_011271 [Phlomoides rotata]